MFTQRAIDLISDAKIEQAIKEGEFDNLPGFGKPVEFDEMSCDSNWWIRRKVEREELKQLIAAKNGGSKQ